MTLHELIENHFAETIHVGTFYDRAAFNNIFTKNMNAFIFGTLHE